VKRHEPLDGCSSGDFATRPGSKVACASSLFGIGLAEGRLAEEGMLPATAVSIVSKTNGPPAKPAATRLSIAISRISERSIVFEAGTAPERSSSHTAI
jgi:hypothetical protein